MKIGIATFHWSDNYGAVLQAYALQTYLVNAGHVVHVLDFRPFRFTPHDPFWKRYLAKSPKRWMQKQIRLVRQDRFERFRKKHLNLSSAVVHHVQELDSYATGLDVLITGSDQVWNPTLTEYQQSADVYFLNFGRTELRRISYAASIGHSEVETLAPWAEVMTNYLKNINHISVRERTGGQIVKSLTGRSNVQTVADPTLLLCASDYRKFFRKAEGNRGGVFSYILHQQDEDAEPYVSEIARFLNQKVTRCGLHELSLGKGYVRLSPERWLAEIDRASFVVTNSFHGVIFCLLLHSPFVVLPVRGKKETMNSRVTELLMAIGLEERLLEYGQAVDGALMNNSVDWKSVDNAVSELRSSGVRFLERVLEGQD